MHVNWSCLKRLKDRGTSILGIGEDDQSHLFLWKRLIRPVRRFIDDFRCAKENAVIVLCQRFAQRFALASIHHRR